MRIDPATRGVVVIIACGPWLAGTSPAAGQTATGTPPAPMQELRTGPSASAAAQFPESPPADAPGLRRFRLEPRFAAGVPVGTFGDNVGASFGGGVDFSVRLGDTPVSVGAALEYLRYGTETRRVVVFTGPPEVVSDISTSNNVYWTHALVRVQPRRGRVRPYADGLLGFSYAFTGTVVSTADTGNEVFGTHAVRVHPDGLLRISYVHANTGLDLGHGTESTTHLGDFASSLGVGVGVTVLLVSGRDAVLGLNLGVRYLATGDLSYLTKGAIQRDESGATFVPVRSPVNVVSPQIGVTLGF